MNVTLRPFHKDDWKSVSTIYEQGLQTRNATFETEVPEYQSWIKKFKPGLLWVATAGDEVIGWAGLRPTSDRKVYEGVVEVTIYVHKDFGGKGVGSALMKHLKGESEKAGIWTLYAAI